MSLGCVWNVFWIALRLLDGHKKYQEFGLISGDEFVLNKYVENMSECHCNILEIMNQRVFSNGLWNIFLEIFFFKN